MRIRTTRGARLFALPLLVIAMAFGPAACGTPAVPSNADKVGNCGIVNDPACDRLREGLGKKWDNSIVIGLQGEDDATALGVQDTYSCDPLFFQGAKAEGAVLIKIQDGDSYKPRGHMLPKGPEIPASDLPAAWKKPDLSKKAFLKLVEIGLTETDKDGPTKLATALGKICQHK